VERTFAWQNRDRRHSKDYERNPDSSVAMIHIAMIKKCLTCWKITTYKFRDNRWTGNINPSKPDKQRSARTDGIVTVEAMS
jgi:hypothetical protein